MKHMTVLSIGILVWAFGTPGLAQTKKIEKKPCAETCVEKKTKCDEVSKKTFDACMARADKYKKVAEERAAKQKDPEKAKTKLEAAYEKMTKVCDAGKDKNEKYCS